MPYQTVNVPPELFMTHNGVHVYHTYRDDDIGQGSRLFWYTLFPRESGEDTDPHFDVRDLELTIRAMDYDNHKRVIREALDDGRLQAPTDAEDNLPYSHTVLVEVMGLAPDADASELVNHALAIAWERAQESSNPSEMLKQIGAAEYDVTNL